MGHTAERNASTAAFLVNSAGADERGGAVEGGGELLVVDASVLQAVARPTTAHTVIRR